MSIPTDIEAAAAEAELLEPLMSSDLAVGEVVRRQVLECGPETPLSEAAKRMSEARCSSILVAREGEVVGIWTERDALAIGFADPAAFDEPVWRYMSSPVKTVPATTTMRQVLVNFREQRMRHYLVVGERGERLGVISQTDVVLNQGIEHYLRLRRVDSVVKRHLVELEASDSLGAAVTAMREGLADAVVVHYPDGGRGIITERDIVRLIAERQADVAVGPLASRPLVTVDSAYSLFGARAVLLESRLRHVGVVDAEGELVGLVSFSDILSGMEHAYVHELQRALGERDKALRVSQRNLHLAEKVIESSLEGIMITDPEGVIESVNPAFSRLTGYDPAEVIGRRPSVLQSGRHDQTFYERLWRQLREHGYWQGEIWNRRNDGEIFPELLTITAICDDDGNLTNYAAVFSDISELKESEEQIRHLAYYDPLTSLPNRRLFDDRLRVAIAHAHRGGRQLALLFVDLDRFKRVNDSLGHSSGDQVLLETARRLVDAVREDDTVARMGGDEFTVILSDIVDPDDAAVAARRVIESLRQPMKISGEEVIVTSSVGIAVYPDDGADPETLVRHADVAMYRTKDIGRDSYQLYTPAMNARSLEHLALETALRHARERDELRLYFQPLVDGSGSQVIGAEALLRWQHPDMGLVPPADFIPLAEESGLIISIGEWVLREACRQLGRWRRDGVEVPGVAVNISPRQFEHENFLDVIDSVLGEECIDPSRLTFELTESTLMADAITTIHRLRAIRERGIRISLDDFGTGYSSLSYLKRFPISKLKIDRAFVRDIERQEEDAAIVSAVIGLAHSLNLAVVAEGVETAGQAARLAAHGCDYLQGFYFGRPVPAESFRWELA